MKSPLIIASSFLVLVSGNPQRGKSGGGSIGKSGGGLGSFGGGSKSSGVGGALGSLVSFSIVLIWLNSGLL